MKIKAFGEFEELSRLMKFWIVQKELLVWSYGLMHHYTIGF